MKDRARPRLLSALLARAAFLVVFILCAAALAWADPAPVGLPPASGPIGPVHRNAEGQIVPGPPPGEQSPAAPAPAARAESVPRREPVAPRRKVARRPAPREGAVRALPAAIVGPALPRVPRPRRQGQITGLAFANLSRLPEPAGIVTFGQVFVEGDLPASSRLKATVDGRDLPLQMDVKTRYRDGSVDDAVLSLELPALKPGERLAAMLAKAPARNRSAKTPVSSLAIDAASVPPLEVQVTFRDGPEAGHTSRVALREFLAHHPHDFAGPAWLEGPLAVERRVRAPLGGGLVAQFDIRLTALGPPSIDLALTYDDAYHVPMRSIHYDISVTDGAKTLLQYSDLKHNHHANWHRILWPDGRLDPAIFRDPAYWIRSGAVPSFDTSIRISPTQIAADYQALAKADTGPMGRALLTLYMPTTGQTDGDEVGLITNTQTKYLLSQDPREAACMFAAANAAGSIPWHFRDGATGRPITITNHPGIRISENGPGTGADKLPQTYDTKDTGWTPDTAHAPALDYLPYLLTGSRYYLNELQFHAAWILAFYNPSFRGGAAGLINTHIEDQVRSFAWDLRTLGDAAYASPDKDPLKRYFSDRLSANLGRLVQHYVVDRALAAAGPVEGWMEGDNRDENEIAPWQESFFAMALGYDGQRGFPAADRLLRWMGNYLTGLYLSAGKGFDPRYASAYELRVRDPATRRPLDSWAKVFAATFGGTKDATDPTVPDLGYPRDPGGYAAASRGALASLINAGGGTRAIAAYAEAVALTQGYGLAEGFSIMPKWALAPRFPDGRRLLMENVHFLRGGGSVPAGGGAIRMLIVPPAGGRIVTGPGDSILVVRGGRTTFVIAADNPGHKVIVGFDPARDRIEISKAAAGPGPDAGPAVRIGHDTDGNLKLMLGPETDVTLIGIKPKSLPDGALGHSE